MRTLFEALDRLEIRYFVTGSVAASVHGVLRQSQDMDVVLDLDAHSFGTLADSLPSTWVIAEPIDFGEFSMVSAIDQDTADKIDLILRRPGPFEASAMDRRKRKDDPGVGSVWVASV